MNAPESKREPVQIRKRSRWSPSYVGLAIAILLGYSGILQLFEHLRLAPWWVALAGRPILFLGPSVCLAFRALYNYRPVGTRRLGVRLRLHEGLFAFLGGLALAAIPHLFLDVLGLGDEPERVSRTPLAALSFGLLCFLILGVAFLWLAFRHTVQKAEAAKQLDVKSGFKWGCLCAFGSILALFLLEIAAGYKMSEEPAYVTGRMIFVLLVFVLAFSISSVRGHRAQEKTDEKAEQLPLHEKETIHGDLIFAA